MNYKVWFDADGKARIIKNMETSHIENCINMIRQSSKGINFHDLKVSGISEYEHIFDYAWCVLHAQGYLKSFEKELIERIKERNYD